MPSTVALWTYSIVGTRDVVFVRATGGDFRLLIPPIDYSLVVWLACAGVCTLCVVWIDSEDGRRCTVGQCGLLVR
jgi:hypothetical protein